MATVLRNARILTGDDFRDDLAVVIEDGRIIALLPDAAPQLGQADEQVDLGGGWLLPGFIDVQVNGGGGALFNNTPDVASLRTIAQAHRRFGTTAMLPTLISDDVDVMREAIGATREAIAQQVPGIIGIHLEGPYIAPARKGTHDASKFRVPDADEIALAASLDNGVTLLTLAPERVPLETIRALVERGVIVTAGHTAGTYEEIRDGLDAGVRGFTHLYNAMSPLQGREPGAVGAALEDRDSWIGIIVDGVHVHPASLRVALAAKPRGRLLLVTENSYRHRLFNGDIGICLRDASGAMVAWFPGDTADQPRAFHPAALPAHESAFAMTVHKAQGSEFDEVWLQLPRQDSRVLSRELVYTGLTRARQRLHVAASEAVLVAALKRHASRLGGLAWRLGAEAGSDPVADGNGL